MLNITDEQKALYKADSVHKTVTISVPNKNITISNSDLRKESVTLTERLETERNLQFMGCNASVFSFECSDLIADIRNEYIEVEIQADTGISIPLFAGYVDEQSNLTFEDYSSKVVAYDPLQRINDVDITAWYNALSFPITVSTFRNSLFTRLGLSHQSVTLVNDNFTLSKTIDDKVITAGNVLKWLCQINGRYGIYGRDKKFHYRKLAMALEGLYPSDSLYPSDTLFPRDSNASEDVLKGYYRSIEYQPFKTAGITKVQIIGQNGAVAGASGNTTGDTFTIANNKLAWGLNNLNAACANILSEVNGVEYTPAIIDAKGLPYLECGDIILANTRRNAITTYILERTLSGIQVLFDDLGSDSDQKRPPYVPNVITDVNANAKAIDTTNQNLTITNTNLQTTNDNLSITNGNLNTVSGRVTTVEGTLRVQGDLIASKASIDSLTAVSARVGSLEADHVSVASLTATNGRITSLATEVAEIDRAYVKRADVQTIVAQSVNSYFASLSSLIVHGNITAQQYSIGTSIFTKQQYNVRLADGSTHLMTYLGAT